MEQVAELLRVLAEPRRLRILYLLMQRELCVCEVLDELDISQPLASHHLRVLQEANLIRSRRQAQYVFYSIVPESLAQVKERLLAHFDPANLPPEAACGMGIPRCPGPEVEEQGHSTLKEGQVTVGA
ncbi:MAG: winged helix-turn-helix transcriptional regulator [Chloroflexia bacterium]|nr:winged helix-turn-helix transcriptional regulator [Chloroflexia bacterium]